MYKYETGNTMANTRVPSVLWNTTQNLTADEKAAARANIGAAGSALVQKTASEAVTPTDVGTLLFNTGNLGVSLDGTAVGNLVSYDSSTDNQFLAKNGQWASPLVLVTPNGNLPKSQLKLNAVYHSVSFAGDQSISGYLAPPTTSETKDGYCLTYHPEEGHYMASSIKWTQPFTTLYQTETVDTSTDPVTKSYTPGTTKGIHLGDGLGTGKLSTYNHHAIDNAVTIVEGMSVTYAKVGIYNGKPDDILAEYHNSKKITDGTYLGMLRGGNPPYTDTSYVTTFTVQDGKGILFRVPPRHFAIASLCIEGNTNGTAITKTLSWHGWLANDSDNYGPRGPGMHSVTRGTLHFNNETTAWANATVLLHNSSDEIKTFSMSSEYDSGNAGTYTTTVYKQVIMFKSPDEPGAFNTPDDTQRPETQQSGT